MSLKKFFRVLTRRMDIVLDSIAGLFFIILAIRALSKIDTAWDSIDYHLPFASRLAGIFPKTEYIFSQYFEDRYLGFPKFGELLQGVFWGIFGTPAAANLANLVILLLLAVTASYLLKIRFWKLSLYLLSIPLVLLHSTSAYTDLIANGLLSIGVVILMHSVESKSYSFRNYILALFPAMLAANTKFQIIPIAFALGLLTSVTFIIKRKKDFFLGKIPSRSFVYFVLVSVLIASIGAFTPIHNYLTTKNPLYPFEVKMGAISFEGPHSLKPKSKSTSSKPEALATHSNYILYLLSVSELHLYNNNNRTGCLFSIDQSCGGGKQYKAYKQGGFFIGNLVVWGLFLAYLCVKYKDKKIAVYLIILFIFFIFVGFMPGARFLRYWLFLPIILAIVILLAQTMYKNKESSLINFISLLQVFLFLFVLRHTYKSVLPKRESINFDKYKISESVNEACLVKVKPRGILYKIANPDVKIHTADNRSDCEFEYFDLKKSK